jgi:CheY-like chemotaxis protein/signal transduction histidine kinase
MRALVLAQVEKGRQLYWKLPTVGQYLLVIPVYTECISLCRTGFMKLIARTVILISVLAFSTCTFADMYSENSNSRFPAWQRAQILEDPTGQLGPDQLTGWQPLSGGINLGQTKSHFWFKLDNGFQRENETWYLHLSNSAIDHLEIYSLQQGEWHKIHSVGDHQPFSQRPVLSPTFILPLDPDTHTHLIHVWGETPLFLPMHLANSTGLLEHLYTEESFSFLMVGIIVAMVLFNLFLWLGTKLHVYGWYVFYITSAFLFSSFINGSAFRYLWPNNLWLQNHSGYLIIAIFFFSALSFANRFLDLKNAIPKYGKWISLLRFVPLLTIPSALVSPYLAFKLVALGPLLMVALVPLSTILAWRKKAPAAAWFTLSWLVMVIGIFALNLTLSGVLPSSFIGHRAMDIGVACESVLLSFALAAKIRVMQRQSQAKDQMAKKSLLAAYNQVDKALEQAKLSNQAKDSFLRVAGHELKTPVHTLMGHLQLLENHATHSHKLEEGIKGIEISAQQLSVRIENLITYSEINAGALKPMTNNVSLHEELNFLITQWQKLSNEYGVQLELKISETVPKLLKMDWLHGEKLLSAALDQEVSMTKKGKVKIEVSAREDWLDVEIISNGLQVDTTTQEWIQGKREDVSLDQTGLGLFVCRSLIHSIHGKVSLRSSADQQRTLSISLPVETVEQPQPHAIESQPATNTNSSLSILAVDDNPVNLKLLTAMLKKLGYQVTSVDSGVEAVELSKQQSFDLILMDCQMPEMDGYEATEKILTEQTQNNNTPIVAVTANSTDSERQKCLDVGMSEFIPKPIRMNVLISCLNKFLPEESQQS